jgi:hypothetical protein
MTGELGAVPNASEDRSAQDNGPSNRGADTETQNDAVSEAGGEGANDGALFHTVAGALAAPDPETFFVNLIGALHSPTVTIGNAGNGPMLRLLGHALADALDEEVAFHEVVDAIDRRHLRSTAAVAIIAAFIARIVSAPSSRGSNAATPADAISLLNAAAQVVQEALQDGAARSWQLLPQIASAIARRNAARTISPATLAAKLPRIWAQFGARQQDNAAPAPGDRWSAPAQDPQLMILNGPVEIVILGR